MKVRMVFSPDAKLSDIRALLDSYAIELSKNGQVYLRCPLHFLEYGTEEPQPITEAALSKILGPIDTSLKLSMIRFEPPVGDDDFLNGIRERTTRWPFHVEQPLSVCFTFDEQWWEYKFSPGKTYMERESL